MAITVVFEITDGLLWESSAGRTNSGNQQRWSRRSWGISGFVHQHD